MLVYGDSRFIVLVKMYFLQENTEIVYFSYKKNIFSNSCFKHFVTKTGD